jgi:hypothetical protein
MWGRPPPEAQAYIRALEARLSSWEGMVQALQEQNHALQAQLHQTSRHSSRPPSSDPPPSQRPKRPRGKRRRGAQPGHPGATRTGMPVEDVDEVVTRKPEQGPRCPAPLLGDEPTPFRQHGIEMPPIPPVLTAYPWHPLRCPPGGEPTRAPWPAGVPRGPYGPRVHATVALCPGASRLSKRTPGQGREDIVGGPRRVGPSTQSAQAPTAGGAAPVGAACACVAEHAVAHGDETSWRQGAKRAGGWGAVTSGGTVCLRRLSRGGHVARALLGAPCGRPPGARPRQGLPRVSRAVAPGRLGAGAARLCSPPRPWRGLGGDGCGPACAGAPDGDVVASGARGPAEACAVALGYAPAAPRGGTPLGSREPGWEVQHRGAVPGEYEAARGTRDIRAGRRRRADPPCSGESPPSGCTTAPHQRWDAK